MSKAYYKICALEECSEPFCTTNNSVKFHSEKCARRQRRIRFATAFTSRRNNQYITSSNNRPVEKRQSNSPNELCRPRNARAVSISNSPEVEKPKDVQKPSEKPVMQFAHRCETTPILEQQKGNQLTPTQETQDIHSKSTPQLWKSHAGTHIERDFWDSLTVSPVGCWEFGPIRNHNGYGVAKGVVSKTYIASRYALELRLGRPIAPGMMALHTCDNPPCCNPEHLYEGTALQNSTDMAERGRCKQKRGVTSDRARIASLRARGLL